MKAMPRELIVVAKPEAGLRVMAEAVTSAKARDVSSLSSLVSSLASKGISMSPLFGSSEERLMQESLALAPEAETKVPDLHLYYKVAAPDKQLEGLAKTFSKNEAVAAAYIKPPPEPAARADEILAAVNAMLPSPASAAKTPDFTNEQRYLNAAPEGIDAKFAWTLEGGTGKGVQIVDIEGEWRFSHEDLKENQGGVAGGIPPGDSDWRNHGTAVIGVFGGDRNSFGITGICPDANIRGISIFTGDGKYSSSQAIKMAADRLNPGDIILIELHRPGPRYNFQGRDDQLGYIAVEWWMDDFDAILYATSRGIVVVEAAGNGAENLDDAIYDKNSPGFPPLWRNPFRRNPLDSGAVVVGAGAPPPGTHGRNWGPNLSRLDFSNYGQLVDAQGWGREVTTTGYGDLQGGQFEDFWYTNQFSGTSSASPVVVGAVGCTQGILAAKGRPKLQPLQVRKLLRATGSKQAGGPEAPKTQNIGRRPDLKAIAKNLKL